MTSRIVAKSFQDRVSSSKSKLPFQPTHHAESKRRKHKKRHEKPYGCTFPQCPKRFGSKNDWKRHENSQHCQLELWRCNEPSRVNSTEICGKACHRREQFRSHISKDHGITDSSEIDRRLDHCRVGYDCDSRFWCGFCKTIIETSGRGLKAGTERFNHIDDHYSGRNSPRRDISEWKSLDPDLPAKSPSSDRDNVNGSSQAASTPSTGSGNGRKREAFPGAQQSRSRKRQRVAVETMWFCVRTHLVTARFLILTSSLPSVTVAIHHSPARLQLVLWTIVTVISNATVAGSTMFLQSNGS